VGGGGGACKVQAGGCAKAGLGDVWIGLAAVGEGRGFRFARRILVAALGFGRMDWGWKILRGKWDCVKILRGIQ